MSELSELSAKVDRILALLQGQQPRPGVTYGEPWDFRAEVMRHWGGLEIGPHMRALLDTLPSNILYRPMEGISITLDELNLLDYNQTLFSLETAGLPQVQLFAGLYDLWEARDPSTNQLIPGLMMVLDPNVIDGKPDRYHISSVRRRFRKWCFNKANRAKRLDQGQTDANVGQG